MLFAYGVGDPEALAEVVESGSDSVELVSVEFAVDTVGVGSSTGSTTVPSLEIELSFCADEAPDAEDDPVIALKSWHSDVNVIAMHRSSASQLLMHESSEDTSRLRVLSFSVSELASEAASASSSEVVSASSKVASASSEVVSTSLEDASASSSKAAAASSEDASASSEFESASVLASASEIKVPSYSKSQITVYSVPSSLV